MRKTRIITEGAVLLAIYAVLLLITLYIPILNNVTTFFLVLPFILFRGRFDRKASGLFFIAAIFISFIVGSLHALPLTFMYGVTGIVLGDYIIRNKSRVQILLAASFAFFITIALSYWLSVFFLQIDYIKELFKMMEEGLKQSKPIIKAIDPKKGEEALEQFQTAVELMKKMVPSIAIIGSIVNIFVIQAISIPIIKRFGIKAESWQPIRMWRLPRAILWIFLGLIVLSFVSIEKDTLIYTVFLNAFYILQLLIMIQGISFLFFIFFQYNLPKGIAIVLTIFMLINPTFSFLLRVLGVIDIGTNWREFFRKATD
ncbi:YybS family protein [Niallia nealsonii]|uniref:DUF2232 domain-containing protein n=1 Tax=Niallia nealsonii TaxID=115979 RepID=A0A2N0Z479_9BACI|nr:YybS family protein [Niallia nealsonii]PKG24300.1 DUF2232 domain-containing protein [Niallia nealsonii]